MKKHQTIAIGIGGLFALLLAVFPAIAFSPRADGSYESVQELFNARCVLCHSCNNAPCQLKLSSYDGLLRGASKIEAIRPTRLQSIPPTRLGIDARSTAEWHEKGFFPVAGEESDLITRMINAGTVGSPADHVADSRTCPADAKAAGAFSSSHPEKLMPYGLPPLSEREREVLSSWVRQGKKPPLTKARENLAPRLALAKGEWEEFLNRQDLEHQIGGPVSLRALVPGQPAFQRRTQGNFIASFEAGPRAGCRLMKLRPAVRRTIRKKISNIVSSLPTKLSSRRRCCLTCWIRPS